MRSKIINTDSELKLFRDKFQARGNEVLLEYLQHSQVRAFFTKQGEMVAGYAHNQVRPLRYEAWMPEAARLDLPLLAAQNKLCEITCIWISRREGRVSSEKIYLYTVLDALFSGAEYMLGGTLSEVVFGIQSQSLPHILYSGPTDYFGTQKKCWIYYASRGALLKQMVTTFPYSIVMGILGKPFYLNRARAQARKLRKPIDTKRDGGRSPIN